MCDDRNIGTNEQHGRKLLEDDTRAKCRHDCEAAVAAATIMEAVEDFARRGLRTLVFAHKTLTEDEYREDGPSE